MSAASRTGADLAHATVPGSERPQTGGAAVRRLTGRRTRPRHVVQFYDSDEFLCGNVAEFLGAGIENGEIAIVIATPAHRAGVRQRLERNGIDVSRAGSEACYADVDAAGLLARFMLGALPDPARFRDTVGGMIAAAEQRHTGRRIRVFGEMVDHLWREGNRDGALALDALWNDLARTRPFALLCAYSMHNFTDAADGAAFESLCRLHTHVMPAEGYSGVDRTAAGLCEISRLQQRAISLEHEVLRRRELERDLQRTLDREAAARAEAERTLRYNERFASMLGHELRNPLNAILTTAHYIERSSSATRTTAAAKRIACSSFRMARMIDQLLDFTRIRVGNGLVPERSDGDLAELAGRIRTELLRAHPEATIALSARGTTRVQADLERILQVLGTVVCNAVHHGAVGGTVTVEVDGTDAAAVEITVHNAGAIPATELPVLFEAFRDLDKGAHVHGLGLGLFISQQIVAAHGGSIGVTSSELAGTTFRIEIPRNGRCLPP
jgi:signal transduction histidine kinase